MQLTDQRPILHSDHSPIVGRAAHFSTGTSATYSTGTDTSGSVHWSRRQQGYEQAKAPFIPRTLGVTVGLLAAGGVSTTEEY